MTASTEMDAYWQDRTEAWQESERGEAMTQDIEQLGDLAAAAQEIAEHYRHR
jgi:hypothetical protein